MNSILFVMGLIVAIGLTFAGFFAVGSEDPTEEASSPSAASQLVPLNALLHALEDGTLPALQLLREQKLAVRSDYESTILPALKEKALEELEKRFSSSDWSSWPRAAYGENGKPSVARLYVNGILAVHEPLGNFLETAALIFHRLWVTTDRGEVYNFESDFATVRADAEEILSYRRVPAIPARHLLDESIENDQQFLAELERIRVHLTTEYLAHNSVDVEQNIALTRGVEPEFATEEFLRLVAEMLGRLSLSPGERVRERVIVDELETRKLEQLAKEDRELARALGRLYVMGALDALDVGDFHGAQTLLDDSSSVSPGLPAHRKVSEYLAQLQHTPRREKRGVVATKQRENENVDEEALPEEETGSSFVGLAPLVFFLMIGILLWRRWLSAKSLSGELELPKNRRTGSTDTELYGRPEEFVLNDEPTSLRATDKKEPDSDTLKVAN